MNSIEKDKLSPIQKTMLILETMSNDPNELNASEISEQTGINRTTAYRILQELREKDWVIQDYKTKKYIIGPMAFHVGMAYTNNNNIESKILEVLNRLCAETKESVGYAMREGDKVISLYEVETHQPYKMNYHPGKFYPMNRGGYGKCLYAYHDPERVRRLLVRQKFEKLAPNTITDPDKLLQEYEKIRKQGYAVSDEEVFPHLMGIGVPVFNSRGEVKGCVAGAFFKERDIDNKLETFLKLLKEGAEEIARYLP